MTNQTRRFRPPSPSVLEQRGGSWMYTTRKETAPEGTYHLAVNMVPVNPEDPQSVLQQRAALSPISQGGSSATGNVITAGMLFNAAGQPIRWIMTSSGLWTVSAVGVYTLAVDSAAFASAGIVPPGTSTLLFYWCIFNTEVVFNGDGGFDTPFSWDGSAGAASLTHLGNAGICFGKPTVRSAKLFFIRFAERDTLAWSEEDDATTGYDAGGFSNTWKLNQTGTAPLYAILGTNDGLYYFRQRSTGVIRGEVNDEFVTSSTHDALSQTIGTVSIEGVEFANGAIWFVDQSGSPYWIRSGGYPTAILPEDSPSFTAPALNGEPLGIYTVGAFHQTAIPIAMPPVSWMLYETVWFVIPASIPFQPGGIVVLVCHATSGKPIAWLITKGNNGTRLAVIRDQLDLVTAAFVSNVFTAFSSANTADRDRTGTVQQTDLVVIGRPLGSSAWATSRFSRMAVLCGGDQSYTLRANLSTSTDPSADIAPILLEAQSPQDGRRVAQFSRIGRWVRPVLWTELTDGSTDVRVTYDGWSVLATPVSAGPTAP